MNREFLSKDTLWLLWECVEKAEGRDKSMEERADRCRGACCCGAELGGTWLSERAYNGW